MKKGKSSSPAKPKNGAPKASPGKSIPIARVTRRPRGQVATSIGRDMFRGSDLLVNDLTGSTTFTATRYNIGPALASLKGLQGIAQRYDKYRWKHLELEYVPKQAVSTTAGMVHLAFDLNPNHTAPSSLSDLSVFEFHDYTQVYGELSLKIGASRLEPFRWVRCGPVPGDLNLYDAVSAVLAVDAMADASAIGDVYLHYEVEFIGRQLDDSNYRPQAMAVYNRSTNQSFTSGVAAVLQFDEVIIDSLEGSMSAGVYTPGCGSFLVVAEAVFSDSASEAFTCAAQIFLNGAATTPPTQTITGAPGGIGANGSYPISFSTWLQCDTDDTISVSVTLTGAAGTLIATADRCRLRIQAV